MAFIIRTAVTDVCFTNSLTLRRSLKYESCRWGCLFHNSDSVSGWFILLLEWIPVSHRWIMLGIMKLKWDYLSYISWIGIYVKTNNSCIKRKRSAWAVHRRGLLIFVQSNRNTVCIKSNLPSNVVHIHNYLKGVITLVCRKWHRGKSERTWPSWTGLIIWTVWSRVRSLMR